jgi:prepilin-type N-terminal cleavage/methylation domain-containing protein
LGRRRIQLLGASQGRILLMAKTRAVGFTLIELLIGLAIAALLLVLALPGYTLWVADAQIRNAAESIASGMRYAQGQAIARNAAVEFVIDITPGTGGWTATLASGGPALQQAVFAEGSRNVTFVVLDYAGGASKKVTFSSLGGIRLNSVSGLPENIDASSALVQVQIGSPVAGARNLNVLVGGKSTFAGQLNQSKTGIKICDPKWPATDPKGCPA